MVNLSNSPRRWKISCNISQEGRPLAPQTSYSMGDTSNTDTANDFFRLNPGILDRSRFKVPTNVLERVDLLGRLKAAKIESYVFKGIGLTKYPVIESRNPDLKAIC